MFDIVTIGILIVLLVMHFVLHTLYSSRKADLDSKMKELERAYDEEAYGKNTYGGGAYGKSAYGRGIVDALEGLARMYAQTALNMASNRYAIVIDAICAGTLIVLAVSKYAHGMPSAEWMSLLFLPAPLWMLGYNINDRLSWPVRRQGSVKGRWLVEITIIALLAAALISIFMTSQETIDQEVVVVMEPAIGVFAVIAVMAGIIAGGIGLRLVHIDSKYKHAIDVMKRERPATKDSLRNGEPSTDKPAKDVPEVDGRSQYDLHRELSDMRGKMEANKRGVLVDGICMIMILVAGMATALGFSPSLLVSAVVSFTCFLSVAVPFHYHAQDVLGESC